MKKGRVILLLLSALLLVGCGSKDDENIPEPDTAVEEPAAISSEESIDSQETDTIIPEPQVAEEEVIEDQSISFESFEDMDYALFLETAFIDDGGNYSCARHGIFGDFTSTVKEGENIYFLLNEKVLGNEMSFSNYIEWRNYSGERIITVTPDLKWIISRSFEDYGTFYHEKWYWNRKEVKTLDGAIGYDMRAFIPRKTCAGEYEAIPEDVLNKLEQMLSEIYFGSYREFDEHVEHWICFDEYGQLLAMREVKEKFGPDAYEEDRVYGPIYNVHKENCIRLYDISKDSAELLYELTLPETEVVWPIEISQIVGTKEEGWVVFSAGDVTYRMSYPDGRTEKLGEFMYRTTFSPNGRYMAYCTGHNTLYNSWEHMEGGDFCLDRYYEMMERWDAVAPG
ncbi:MAG: hypothetical protein K2O32_15025 [Acetatifactor sp.]|nr:hypothetical protein [Acetatifactor sp.]